MKYNKLYKLPRPSDTPSKFEGDIIPNVVRSLILSSFFFLLFSFSFLPSAFSQIDPPLRIELECAKDQQDYKFASLENQGVAVFYKSEILSMDTVQWVFIHYDTNLVKINQYKLKLPNSYQYMAADFSNNKLYLFLQKPARKKDPLKNYLLEWNLITSEFQLFDLQNHTEQLLSSLHVTDDYLFMIADEQKTKSICYYNFKTNAKQTVQITDAEVTAIESFRIDTLTKTTYFCMFLKNKQNSRAELFVTDYSGNIKERIVFPSYNDFIYNSVEIALVGKDSLLLVGGYTNSKEKKPKGSFSGIYTMHFSKNKFSANHTYPFQTQPTKDSVLSKKPLSEPNQLMNLHITQSNGKVFAITEFFYPEYQNSSSSFRNYGNSGFGFPLQSFLGFRFLNAEILEFNASGTLTNQWYFPVIDVLTQSIFHLVNLYQDSEENTLFYYVHRNNIVSQFMNGKRLISPQTTIPIELTNKADVSEYSTDVNIKHWYNNNFLLSGYQYIKNTQRNKGKRYVFFINKLTCD